MAIKQDKEGYVLTLRMHPDEIPENLLRDYVGARYQCVLVRLNGNDKPMNKEIEYAGDRLVQMSGLLCRDPDFWDFLFDRQAIMVPCEIETTEYLRRHLGVQTRADLRTNSNARDLFNLLHEEFMTWKREKN